MIDYMTVTPGVLSPAYTATQPVAGTVVQPTAIAGPKPSAVVALGELLKDVLHKTGVFHHESQLDSAMNVIDDFVRAFATPAELRAVLTGEQRAAKEDVSLREPPGGRVQVVHAPAGPAIDYERLAAAIHARMVASQQQVSE